MSCLGAPQESREELTASIYKGTELVGKLILPFIPAPTVPPAPGQTAGGLGGPDVQPSGSAPFLCLFPEHTHLAKLEADQPEEIITVCPPCCHCLGPWGFYSPKFNAFSI